MNRYDVILSKLHPSIPFMRNASIIKQIHEDSKASTLKAHSKDSFSLNHYSGSNQNIIQMKEYLVKELSNDLQYAILHGSFATDDEIPFSDFDGLIILKDEVFDNTKRLSRVAQTLSKSCSIMVQLDPLQHHGWFVFSENDCNNWPESVFPKAIISNSKILFSKSDNLNIHFVFDIEEVRTNLLRLIKSIQNKITSKNTPKELYSLKSRLSEFMLLPSLLLQLINKRGVYKKFSFSEASQYFHPDDYSIMNDVSLIRSEWPLKTSSLQMQSIKYFSPGIKNKQIELSFPIPAHIKVKLNDEFYNRMYNLTLKVEAFIK